VASPARRRFPAARGLVLASLALVVAALAFLPRVQFEYRLGELDPTYPEWTARNLKVRQAFDDRARRNPAYVVLDTPAEVPAVVAVGVPDQAADQQRHVHHQAVHGVPSSTPTY
jgi:hypothetical protein